MKKLCIIIIAGLLVISFTNCQQKKTLLGKYINVNNETKLTITETMGWGEIEYVLNELGVHRLGRFNTTNKIMTVFKNIRPDYFEYYLQFSDDFNFVYLKETGKLMYVKADYYEGLSYKEKNALKLKKN